MFCFISAFVLLNIGFLVGNRINSIFPTFGHVNYVICRIIKITVHQMWRKHKKMNKNYQAIPLPWIAILRCYLTILVIQYTKFVDLVLYYEGKRKLYLTS